jgi:hypothetical protein
MTALPSQFFSYETVRGNVQLRPDRANGNTCGYVRGVDAVNTAAVTFKGGSFAAACVARQSLIRYDVSS